MKKGQSKNKWFVFGIVCGAILIIAAALSFMWTGGGEPVDWEVTLMSKSGEKVVQFDEICKMPSRKAQGGFFTTVGVVNGPFKVKGVSVVDLCSLVGGVTPAEAVIVSADDGYSMMFGYDQLTGNINTYDPETLQERPHDELGVLLTYEQDGKPLSHADGNPLRVAVVGNADLLTEGHWWVKWVTNIEIVDVE
jgi:DMSO/TMAO reductase YedYZ molybdopterin-dependent catalytic subunit